MNKLQGTHAKLLYFSTELCKNNTISESEKVKLKEMVINDDPKVFGLLDKYQNNGNEQELINGILLLVKPSNVNQQQQPTIIQEQRRLIQPQKSGQQQQQQPQQVEQPKFQSNQQVFYEQQQVQQVPETNEEITQFIEKHPDCPDEISSPLGLKLLKRKQKQKKMNQQGLDFLKPYKMEQE